MSLYLFFFICIGLQIGRSVSDNGDCENKENPKGRNFIHNETVEVDPCGPPTFIKCLKPEVTNCTTTTLNGDDSAYEIIVGEYEPKVKTVRFALIIPLTSEFYIYVHSSDADGNITDNATKLGYFDDSVFPSCNSYACCDSVIKTKPNVARRCPYSLNATTRIPEREGFYGITYLWYPPREFQGYIIFVAEVSDSEAIHYEKITSKAVSVDTIIKKITTTAPSPPPLSTPESSSQPYPTTPSSKILITTEHGELATTSSTVSKSGHHHHKKHKTKPTTTVATTEASPRHKHKKHKKKKEKDDDNEDEPQEKPPPKHHPKHKDHSKTPASDEDGQKAQKVKKVEPVKHTEEHAPKRKGGLIKNLVNIELF